MVDDLEARRLPGPVDRGHVEEEIELELGLEPLRPCRAASAGATTSTSDAVRDRASWTVCRQALLEELEHVRGHDQKSAVRIGWRERAIWSCSFMIPSITVSGRGGQPGT